MFGLYAGIYTASYCHKTKCGTLFWQFCCIRKLLKSCRSICCGKSEVAPFILTSCIGLKTTHWTFFFMRAWSCNCPSILYKSSTQQAERSRRLRHPRFYQHNARVLFTITLQLFIILLSLEFRWHIAGLVKFVKHVCTG